MLAGLKPISMAYLLSFSRAITGVLCFGGGITDFHFVLLAVFLKKDA